MCLIFRPSLKYITGGFVSPASRPVDRSAGGCHGNPSRLSAATVQQTTSCHSGVQVQHVHAKHGHFHGIAPTSLLILWDKCSYRYFVALLQHIATGGPQSGVVVSCYVPLTRMCSCASARAWISRFSERAYQSFINCTSILFNIFTVWGGPG